MVAGVRTMEQVENQTLLEKAGIEIIHNEHGYGWVRKVNGNGVDESYTHFTSEKEAQEDAYEVIESTIMMDNNFSCHHWEELDLNEKILALRGSFPT